MGKLKDAVMAIQDSVFEETGEEIDFDEAGRRLTLQWVTKTGALCRLPVAGGEPKVKCLGAGDNAGEYRFELLEETESHKAGAIVVLRESEIKPLEVL